MEDLIQEAARRSACYLKSLEERSVAPSGEAVERLKGFDIPLQNEPMAPMKVLAGLDDPDPVAEGLYFGEGPRWRDGRPG